MAHKNFVITLIIIGLISVTPLVTAVYFSSSTLSTIENIGITDKLEITKNTKTVDQITILDSVKVEIHHVGFTNLQN